MITVWGRDTSSNVQMVVWALAELGLPYERLDIGGAFGGNDTAAFKAMNPNGLVPVLRDGDSGPYLWESAAIVRYLGARYGNASFWPSDPAARGEVDKWADWIKTTFGPAFLTGIFTAIFRTAPASRDAGLIAANEARMAELAAILDARLAKSPYIGGETICFADMIVGTLLFRYFTMDGFNRPDLPNLRAYYDRLAARPLYAKHVMISYESMRAI